MFSALHCCSPISIKLWFCNGKLCWMNSTFAYNGKSLWWLFIDVHTKADRERQSERKTRNLIHWQELLNRFVFHDELIRLLYLLKALIFCNKFKRAIYRKAVVYKGTQQTHKLAYIVHSGRRKEQKKKQTKTPKTFSPFKQTEARIQRQLLYTYIENVWKTKTGRQTE